MEKKNKAFKKYFHEHYGSKTLTVAEKKKAEHIAGHAFEAGVEHILERLDKPDFLAEGMDDGRL